jgi:20S proteasome alpha/beta subunit
VQPLPARHFGVGFLFAGYEPGTDPTEGLSNKTCWSLYELDPTGIFVKWDARAVGDASERAEAMLNSEYRQGLSLPEAKKVALHIMDTILDVGAGTPSKAVEMSCLTRSKDGSLSFSRLTDDDIARLRTELTTGMGLVAPEPEKE